MMIISYDWIMITNLVDSMIETWFNHGEFYDCVTLIIWYQVLPGYFHTSTRYGTAY